MAGGQIPNARVPILQTDGTLTLPWRLYLTNLGTGGSGTAADIAALQAAVALLATEVATADANAAQALAEVSQALAEALQANAVALPLLGALDISIGTGTGLTGGPIYENGTISFAPVPNLDVLANISGASAPPIPNTLTAIIDACLGSTQGDILYRDSAAWKVLAPGTSGQFLETQGASADPQWATVSGGGLTGTYNNVTASRSLGTLYTNTNTVPIFISAYIQFTAGGNDVVINVSGNQVGQFIFNGTGFTVVSLFAFANPGETYEIISSAGTNNLSAWYERY